MEDYRANSHKAKEEAAATKQEPEKKKERVAKGAVSIQKKSPVRKFVETFVKRMLPP